MKQSHLPDVEHGNTTDGELESLSSDESGFEAKDNHSNLPPSMQDSISADATDLPRGSSIQTRSQKTAETEMRDQIKKQSETVQSCDSGILQLIRRREDLSAIMKTLLS